MSKCSETFLFCGKMEWEPFGDGMERKLMGYNDDLMIHMVKFTEGVQAALHSHPHSQTTTVMSGKYEFTVGDRTEVITAGDTVLIKPNELHRCVCLEAGVVIDAFSPMREDFIK